MPITRLSPEQLKEFDRMVQQTAMKFPGEVIRIRYSFGDDWYDPAIFFRILLADDTRRDDQFVNITKRVEDALHDGLGPAASEYWPFVTIRTKAEQDKLQDPEWE